MVMGRDYHREYSRNYYRQKRAEYTALLGGRCVRCSATEKLQFDHIEDEGRIFRLGKLLSFSKEKAIEELKKCQLLCWPCHWDKTCADKGWKQKRRRVASMVETLP